jgi:hypothetical protein
MRTLHRDIGFLVIGMTVVFCLSGIALVYRNTLFLKSDVTYEKQLDAALSAKKLQTALRFRRFTVVEETDTHITFKHGTYDKTTGKVSYTVKDLPWIFRKMKRLHLVNGRNPRHIFVTIYGVLLLFLALSSLGMHKPGSRIFSRGLKITILGIVGTALLLFW